MVKYPTLHHHHHHHLSFMELGHLLTHSGLMYRTLMCSYYYRMVNYYMQPLHIPFNQILVHILLATIYIYVL